MFINGGYQKNEFINSLDNKRFDELSSNLKKFVKTVYPNVKNKDVLICKKCNGMNANLSLSLNGCIKYISLKSGNTSVFYRDYICVFISKIIPLNVSAITASSLYRYHRGYTVEDDESFGSLLKVDFKKEISIVRNEFENKELLSKLIDMILMEKNNIKVDFFYYGNVQIGHTLSSDVFKERLLADENNYPHDFMRVGPFNFLPVNRKIKTGNNTLCQLRINNIYKYFK
jgi:hypothetical protein